MLYGDVRMCMLAGRIMALDAAKKVSVLNITRAEQLKVQAAKHRFPNVEEVNVFSLDRGEEDQLSLSSLTISLVVFFLQTFPCLKRAHVGGASTDDGPFDKGDCNYDIHGDYVQADHQTLIKGLVLTFCGAFRSGLLPEMLQLSGIFPNDNNWTYECGTATRRSDIFSECDLCRHVCNSFPFAKICDHLFGLSGGRYCFAKSSQWKSVVNIIANRRGGMEYLTSKRLMDSLFVGGYFDSYIGTERVIYERKEHQILSLKECGRGIFHLANKNLELIKSIGETFGLRWTASKTGLSDVISEVYNRCIYAEQASPSISRYLMDKETHDGLTSAGVDVDPELFVIVGSKADLARLLPYRR